MWGIRAFRGALPIDDTAIQRPLIFNVYMHRTGTAPNGLHPATKPCAVDRRCVGCAKSLVLRIENSLEQGHNHMETRFDIDWLPCIRVASSSGFLEKHV